MPAFLNRIGVFLVLAALMGCEGPPSSGGNAVRNKPGPVDPDAPEEFTTTASGLKYRIRRKSDGKRPTVDNTVKVHYVGWFDGGRAFDGSYKRGEPVKFPLRSVIPGWTEGLQLIGEGGMIELEVPYELGYGEKGQLPTIPPKATLHFLIELFQVK